MESSYKGTSTDQESSPLGIEKTKIGTRKINLGKLERQRTAKDQETHF